MVQAPEGTTRQAGSWELFNVSHVDCGELGSWGTSAERQGLFLICTCGEVTLPPGQR